MRVSLRTGGDISSIRLVNGARVLAVAETYDKMTAMKFDEEPASEVEALKYLLNNPEVFHSKVVEALIKSINILVPGVSGERDAARRPLALRQTRRMCCGPWC